MTNQYNDYYQTSDLALACTISLWFPIEQIDKQDPRKAIFIFERTPELDNLIDQYWKKELKVDPQEFFTQIKIVKSRLYATD